MLPFRNLQGFEKFLTVKAKAEQLLEKSFEDEVVILIF